MSRAPRLTPYLTRDGCRLFARVWRPAAEPKARLVALHGLLSHSGWYSASSARLAEADCEVHFLDRRGAGVNAAQRGDAPSADALVADVEDYLAALPADVPRLLTGLSWGGRLAAVVAARRPDLVARLGLLYPAIVSRVRPAALQRAMLHVVGRLGLDRARRQRLVRHPLADPAWFTDDPAWQTFIASDPLALRSVTVRFLCVNQRLEREAIAAAGDLRTPTTLFLAGRDRIVDNAGTRGWLARVAAPTAILEYPAAAHTLEFEPDREAFFRDLVAWACLPAT